MFGYFRRIDLKKKLVIAAGIPTAAFFAVLLVAAGYSLNQLKYARQGQANAIMVRAASQLIHELQKERGRSATFLNGGVPWQEVNAQRQLTDQKMPAYDVGLARSIVTKEVLDRARAEMGSFGVLRLQVEKKELGAPEAIKKYSDLISALLALQLGTAHGADNVGLGGKIRSIAVLESAKENAGKLRAGVASVLAADKGVSDAQLEFLIGVKGGVDSSLRSPALQLSLAVADEISVFLKSSEWGLVNEVFLTVMRRAEQGGFGRDPSDFFNIITSSIDRLGLVVSNEVDSLEVEVNALNRTSFKRLLLFGAILIGAILGLLAMLRSLILSISLPIQEAIMRLSESAGSVATSSSEIDKNSEHLAAAATEAAASLQETVASVEEISAMVQKNAEYSERAKSQSEGGRDAVLNAQTVVDKAALTIQKIDESNRQTLGIVTEGNRKIAEIVKVIAEIEQKTKVINDIVFQTKLLSFNASVEAARAGESGKGFAVVAEEVGKLAQMSGKAALEINDMLNKGLQHVQFIVKETTRSVETAFSDSKEKVDEGIVIIGECKKVLATIVVKVSEISEMVSEISTASKEQALGVDEITKAMGQMDQVTQQNASSAAEGAASAKKLSVEADELRQTTSRLVAAVEGAHG